MKRPFCCFITDKENPESVFSGCSRVAMYEIISGSDTDTKNTVACDHHLEQLLDESSFFQVLRLPKIDTGCEWATTDELQALGQMGDFCFTNEDRDIWIRLPSRNGYERGELIHLFIRKIGEAPMADRVGPVWEWDGNRETPTISPSINVIGDWHGYFKAGKLEIAQ